MVLEASSSRDDYQARGLSGSDEVNLIESVSREDGESEVRSIYDSMSLGHYRGEIG